MTPLSNEKDIDILDRYIHGLSSQEDTTEVEERLHTDVSFRDTYNLLLSVSEGTRVDGLSEKWSQLRTIESNISEDDGIATEQEPESNITERKKKRFPYIRIAIAAILLFLIGMTAGKIMKKNNEIVMPVAELEPYIRHETIRSSQKKQLLTDDQQMAYNNYVLRDFRDAKPLLKNLWDNERDTLALYYLGISQWYSGEENKAKEILELPFYKTYEKPY